MKLAKTRCSFLRGASKYSTIEIVGEKIYQNCTKELELHHILLT